MPKSHVEVGPPRSRDELEQFAAVVYEALGFPGLDQFDWLARYVTDDFRLVRVGGEVAGGGVLLRFGQWFGGRPVPMVGIHAVGIAPEHRGDGVGSALMTSVVRELCQSGVPLSVLYPATQPIYRRVGYELAGTWTRYRIPVAEIDLRERGLPVERVALADAADLQAAYDQRAAVESGNLDRTPWCWQRILDPARGKAFGFRVREHGRTRGFAVFSQRWLTTGLHDYDLMCHELCALDRAAAARLLTLLADHRSLAVDLLVNASPSAPVLGLLAERCLGVDQIMRWMARITRVDAALTGRGYPADLTATLGLAVTDDLCPENHGPRTLRVAGGRAEVTEGADAAPLEVDVRGLAALYTGYLTAEQAASIGLAAGNAETLARATRIFAGPAPWMAEIF